MEHITNEKSKYISRGEAANFALVSKATIDRWVSKNCFPQPRKLPGKVLFVRQEVEDWVEARRKQEQAA